jgi:hypothetical protein
MIFFEHSSKPLLSRRKFYRRVLRNLFIAFLVITASLGIGVIGYMSLADMNFVDALLNASMILGGMGPVDILNNDEAKYFASFYALFSGITFLSTVGVIFAPIIHRAMHRFHLETEDEEKKEEKKEKRN